MQKIDVLRKLNEQSPEIAEQSPEIAEQLITRWGSQGLSTYLIDLMCNSGNNKKICGIENIDAMLCCLKDEHDREYPRYAIHPDPEMVEKLTQTPAHQTISTRFPHIGKKLAVLWGQALFCDYTNELMNNNRGTTRQGFPEDVVLALFQLIEAHDQAYPQFAAKVSDIWTLNNRM